MNDNHIKLDGLIQPLPSNRISSSSSSSSSLIEIRPNRRLQILDMPSITTTTTNTNTTNTSTTTTSTKSDVTVFLIHGAMATYKQYYGIINGLITYDYNIVAFDYLGCGDSDKPYDYNAYNTNNHHEDILAIFNKYKTKKNILIGHSYGTSQIARLVTKITDNDTINNIRVVLLGTAYDLPNGGHPIFKLPVCILSLLSSYLSKQFILVAFSNKTSNDIKNISSSISGKNNMTICKYFYTQFEWVNSNDWLSLCDINMLIIQGKDDLITNEDNSYELYNYIKINNNDKSKVDYKLIDDCGHMILLEKANVVTNYILDFIK